MIGRIQIKRTASRDYILFVNFKDDADEKEAEDKLEYLRLSFEDLALDCIEQGIFLKEKKFNDEVERLFNIVRSIADSYDLQEVVI